jgi:S-adenosylmethionine:tRNA ribosyltransferase-isomerase
MKTSDFDYLLPPERIAQSPAEPRDHSRLMAINRAKGTWEHRHFFEIGEYLRPGDLLVVNESRVFKARLFGTSPNPSFVRRGDERQTLPLTKGEVEGVLHVEIFLIRPHENHWLAMGKPGRKLQPGSVISFDGGMSCEIIQKNDDGTILIDFKKSAEEIFAWTEKYGDVPTPPYVTKSLDDPNKYQTVYANQTGSVAAPTAGFHFTSELIASLKNQGIQFASVVLHVGIGTFRPMKTETLEEHVMHEEWIDVPDETMKLIEETRAKGGRVIAVGTTTVRALESDVRHGFTNMFITPGYTFKYIDGLITNFHLPKSTLLVLVSSFAGRELMLKAYTEAIQHEYRFYSFGDAMLII